MHTKDQLKELDNPALNPDQCALLRCRIASKFIYVGQYKEAREALGELWQGTGKRPELKGLKSLTAAEVLLQCGTLSGWLGSARQAPGIQEKAKDLLSEALGNFQSQGQHSKASEAQYELGVCYWRMGAYDESRIVLNQALERIEKLEEKELKAKILICRTHVEIWTGRYHDAWRILEEARDFFESCNDVLKGKWHGQLGLVLRRLATAEGRADYADRAIIEFTAAIYHYEQAKHERYCAINLNNLAMLLYRLKRFREAHENLDRAVRTLTRLKDDGLLAQVNETRARVLVAEQRYEEAEKVIAGVVQTLEKGEEHALLADALTIQGVVWARLGETERSIRILRRAMAVAYDSGATSNTALAALTLIEEHGTCLPENEIYKVYRRADNLLKETQDAEEIARLRACARIVIKRLFGPNLSDKDFHLPSIVQRYEARFIEQALELEAGSVSRAAKRLGFNHHESLTSLLKRRHYKLLSKRTPANPRKQI